MADIQLPAWLVAIIGPGLPAAGWYLRMFFERKWQREDRAVVRKEANLEKQLKLLRHLHGELYQKWNWLADHLDAADRAKAEPVANEIGMWLYKHSAYFPDRQRVTMVKLSNLTFHLATELRPQVLWPLRRILLAAMWTNLRAYQQTVEKKLGLS